MSEKEQKVLLGLDPEFFIADPNGRIVSSIGRIGGDKGAPKKISSMCGILEDNVTIEMNTIPATPKQFNKMISASLRDVRQFLARMQATLVIRPVHTFEEVELMDPKAQVFGCDPDFDAYRGGAIRQPLDPGALGGKRFAGGHIHVSMTKQCPLSHVEAAMLCDALIGLPIVSWTKESDRSEFYGQPGIFRVKEYGLEYRTPSNEWLGDDLRSAMIARITTAAEIINHPNAKDFLKKVPIKDQYLGIRMHHSRVCRDLADEMLGASVDFLHSNMKEEDTNGEEAVGPGRVAQRELERRVLQRQARAVPQPPRPRARPFRPFDFTIEDPE